MIPPIGPLPLGIAEFVDLLFSIVIIVIIIAVTILLIKYFVGGKPLPRALLVLVKLSRA